MNNKQTTNMTVIEELSQQRAVITAAISLIAPYTRESDIAAATRLLESEKSRVERQLSMERGPLWIKEHGHEFAVPAWVFEATGVTDVSWHNDFCPSFERVGSNKQPYRMYVGHPDENKREIHAVKRFNIMTGDDGNDVVLDTNDEHIAQAAWRAL